MKKKKRKQTHFTPDQLKQQLKRTAKLKKYAESSSFTGLCSLCSWILWKTEKMGATKLLEYNQKVQSYYSHDWDEAELAAMKQRLKDKTGFTVDVITYDHVMLQPKKRPETGVEVIARMHGEVADRININTQKYLYCHFAALMDMGFGKKRLTRVKDEVNARLDDIAMDCGPGAMEMRKELMDKVGIVIEMPNQELPDVIEGNV